MSNDCKDENCRDWMTFAERDGFKVDQITAIQSGPLMSSRIVSTNNESKRLNARQQSQQGRIETFPKQDG